VLITYQVSCQLEISAKYWIVMVHQRESWRDFPPAVGKIGQFPTAQPAPIQQAGSKPQNPPI
jgi:hypothetical protein